MSRRKTDGERIAQRMKENWAIHGAHVEATAQEIDRIIKRRMAEAWDRGCEQWFRYGELSINPYRSKKKEAKPSPRDRSGTDPYPEEGGR